MADDFFLSAMNKKKTKKKKKQKKKKQNKKKNMHTRFKIYVLYLKEKWDIDVFHPKRI